MSTSYATVLRTPGAARIFAAALTGRLSYGIVPLSLLLAVTGTTGSYARAGWVMAGFATATVVLSPVRAGLVDRFGPRRALPPMAAGYALVLLGLAAATWRPGVPFAVLLALAAAAGMLARRSDRSPGRCGARCWPIRTCAAGRTAWTRSPRNCCTSPARWWPG